MQDRVPTQVLDNGAIRYEEFNSSSVSQGYKYLKLADEPLVDGTPLNKAFFDSIAPQHFEATISTTWVGDEAPYTQEVTVNGITANDIVKIWVNHNGTLAENKTFDENYNLINDLDSGANKITLTCFYDKPTVAIPVFLEVIR